MEMVFDSDALYAAVHVVSAAITTRSPRPSLQCIHVETRGREVVFSATDLSVAIRHTVAPKELSGGGKALIAGTKLDGLLREASEKEVTLSFEEGSATVRAGRSRFRLVTQDVADYPVLPEFGAAVVTLPAAKMDELARRSVFAVAEEGGRYAIDGVSMVVGDGMIRFAATDGRRLAVAEAQVQPGAEIGQCILSKEMVGRLRALAAGGEPIGLAVEEGKLLSRGGGVLVAGSLVEGSFPAYMSMVPEDAGRQVTVSATELASRLRQASQLTTEDSRAVTFRIERGRMVIEARSAAIGEGSIEIDAAYDGDPVVIAFNPQFLLQVMGEFAEGEFTMEILSGDRPAVVRREGFIYVVAPVRVKA